MSNTFLLCCPDCGFENGVTAALAGTEISCKQCQIEISVPKLGDLRSLPRAESAPDQKLESSWNVPKAVIFCFGLLETLICLSVAGRCFWVGYSFDTEDKTKKQETEAHKQIDRMNDYHVYQRWNVEVSGKNQWEWKPSEEYENRQKQNQYLRAAWILVACSLLGVVTMVAGVLVKTKKE